jgi:hypothetical protein
MNTILKTLIFTLLTGCVSAPQAGSLVEVTVTNRTTGAQQPLYRHQGKLYVAGSPGDRYAVSLRNKTAGRVLTVLSVDGVNAISGETAAVDQAGYVLDPYALADVTGWRKSMSDVAAFVFTSLPDSYAARTGRPGNVGVIGVAVYREQPTPRYVPAPQSAAPMEQNSADSAGVMSEKRLSETPRREDKLGTGHGQQEHSPVFYTEFKRESDRPYETISIYYDSKANLIAMGVLPKQPKCLTSVPEPFPASARFVPDPY